MEYYQIGGIILGAFAVCALCTLLLLPQLKKLKAGQSIREEGPQSHMAKSGTPTMGGIAIFCAVAMATLAGVGFDTGRIFIVCDIGIFG